MHEILHGYFDIVRDHICILCITRTLRVSGGFCFSSVPYVLALCALTYSCVWYFITAVEFCVLCVNDASATPAVHFV